MRGGSRGGHHFESVGNIAVDGQVDGAERAGSGGRDVVDESRFLGLDERGEQGVYGLVAGTD